MAQLDVESSAQAPAEVLQKESTSRLEKSFASWGIFFGFVFGLIYVMKFWADFWFVGVVLSMSICGILSAWIFHLCFTSEENRAPKYCPAVPDSVPGEQVNSTDLADSAQANPEKKDSPT